MVVSDAPYAGVVIRDQRAEAKFVLDGERATVTADAGMTWDDLVAECVRRGLSGLEALSGIPGTVGAAPVQNIGAYGHEVSEVLDHVRVYDRATGEVRRLDAPDLKLRYRSSILKRTLESRARQTRMWGDTGRWVVLDVTLGLRKSRDSAPIRYAELARKLGVAPGASAPSPAVRDAVLDLRRSKGMVLDAEDHDTWSVGSFFTNPILQRRRADRVLPFKAPRFPVSSAELGGGEGGAGDEFVKTSAAWLIERSGFFRGFGLTADARARLSTKHVLAITNRGGATSGDIVALARAVQSGVQEHFDILLSPEPVLVGVTL